VRALRAAAHLQRVPLGVIVALSGRRRLARRRRLAQGQVQVIARGVLFRARQAPTHEQRWWVRSGVTPGCLYPDMLRGWRAAAQGPCPQALALQNERKDRTTSNSSLCSTGLDGTAAGTAHRNVG